MIKPVRLSNKKQPRTAPPTQLEVEQCIEGFYSEYVILMQTQKMVLVGVREGEDTTMAHIFEIDQKNFWTRVGYIGTELVRLEKRDLGSEQFEKIACKAFQGLE